ncbi:hypothetical protein Poli38472_013146 [Pythium oligandrum]|uniref:5'-nucleotidase n=1 Tax=Pythium oligandrum TaxID=41045 RepID=A0A8K1C2I1_PYTOL|nr:hypothetical protein Poli38472_013146 [Pythium oligandrum]|eukprot:TMW55255.1 hypothetical protein Poli38472_013146 [Pythium oligandrum]
MTAESRTDVSCDGSVTPKDQNALVVVLSVNDVYDMYPDQQGRGGMAEFATLLERERAKIPAHAKLLVTLNGDFLSGSQVAERHKGAHMIELLNHLGIEYVVLGNHEFDFGDVVLRERMAESRSKWFGSNVIETATGKLFPGVIDTEIVELTDGLKLGVFGVCTQETPNLSYPGDNIVFDDVFATSKRCVRELQDQGADFIIALTHLSIAQDKLLARKVPGIDVMLGGHDHEPFTLYEGKTLVHKSGQNAFWLARMEFHLSKSGLQPERPLAITPQWTMIANQNIPPQASTQEIVAKYMKALADAEDEADAKRVLATLALPLSTKTSQLRAGECNMGNLVADAIRSELSADFGLMNGGFIRGDTSYEARTVMTMGMLNQEMPFPRIGVVVRIKINHFRDAIVQHFSKYPQLSGSYPHISGLRVTIDRRTNPSEPTITEMVDASGTPLDMEAEVNVATSDFTARGSEGCTAWKQGKIIHTGERIAAIVSEFLLKKRLIAYLEREGRITILE